MSRIYLNVPYAQKDEAKRIGAKWDAAVKKWYVPPGENLAFFRTWLPLVGKPKLTIELVPSSCWYSNVQSNVTRHEWDKLRRLTYQKAKHLCEICGEVGKQHPVECHEIWHYDDEYHIQTLEALTALCPACHECKHIGLAQVRERGEIALRHLAHVNGWSQADAEVYVFECFEIWQQRSEFEWVLDISYLKQFGLSIDFDRGMSS